MVFLFLVLLPLSLAGVFIQETNQTFPATKVFSIDWTNETYECVTPNAPNITQKYVLIPFLSIYTILEPGFINTAVYFNDVVKDFQDRGAIGVLFISTSKYVGHYGLLYREHSDIVIPVAEVSLLGEIMLQMVTSNNSIHISVTSDPNIFEIYLHSPGKYAYQTLMVAWWFGISILCVVKLVQIIGSQECQLNIAISCLFLELCCSLLRVLQYIFSPMQWNETIPVTDGVIFTTIGLPFEISSCTFLLFFWLDIAKGKLKESKKMLGRFQNCAIFLCILMFAIEISLDIVNGIIGLPDVAVLMAFVYVSIGVSLAIFYHIAAIRLWIYSSQIMRRSKMKILTLKVQISGFSIIVGVILSMVLSLIIDPTPTETAVFWSFVNLAFGITSISQILVFGSRRKKLKSTSSKNSGVPNTVVQ